MTLLQLVKNFNMKKIIITVTLFFIGGNSINAQVGIATEEPTRMLDVNGNLRVSGVNDQTNNVVYDELLAANSDNNIDKVSKPSIIDDGTKQVEIVKNIYNATTSDNTKITDCGKLMFRLNGSAIEMRLKDAITGNLVMTYGGKRWGQTDASTSTGYTYNNLSLTFTSANWNSYQNLDTNFTLRVGAYLNYHFIIPNDGDLYRLTVSQLKNDATKSNYSLICERFYKTTL